MVQRKHWCHKYSDGATLGQPGVCAPKGPYKKKKSIERQRGRPTMAQRNLCLYHSLLTGVKLAVEAHGMPEGAKGTEEETLIHDILSGKLQEVDLKNYLIDFLDYQEGTSFYDDTLEAWRILGNDARNYNELGDVYMLRIFTEAFPFFRVYITYRENGEEHPLKEPLQTEDEEMVEFGLLSIGLLNEANLHWICIPMG